MGCSGSKDAYEPAAATAGNQKAEAGETSKDSGKQAPEGDAVSDSTVVITLDAGKSAQVGSLFSTWDLDATGKLELAVFSGVVMKVGPHQTKVLARLMDMDIDHDGFVTKEVTNQLPAAAAAHLHPRTRLHLPAPAACTRPCAPSVHRRSGSRGSPPPPAPSTPTSSIWSWKRCKCLQRRWLRSSAAHGWRQSQRTR